MKVYSHSLQGLRESNEDQHTYFLNLDGNNSEKDKINFFGVFDGHGGKTVSKYLKNNVPKYFCNNNIDNYSNSKLVSKYINYVFNDIQNNLEKDHPRSCNYTGSTALCGIVAKHNNKNILWVANVGDSRAVLCNSKNEAVQLSQDHKPNSEIEKLRINQLGGKIRYDGSDWRINDLSLSRAFGDVESKPFVTHLPQVFKYNINKKDKFIIFACDGLWDVISNNKSVNFVNKLINKNYQGNYAKKLSEKAIQEGSTDNVTVVIVFFY